MFCLDVKPREISGDGVIETHFPLLHELHDRHGGKYFGNGCDAITRIWRCWNFFANVGIPKALLVHEFALIHNTYRESGNILVLYLVRQPRIQYLGSMPQCL